LNWQPLLKQASEEFLNKLDVTPEKRSFADQCGQALFRAAVMPMISRRCSPN
jgi:hypothetical protein